MNKKILTFITIFTTLLTMTACGKKAEEDTSSKDKSGENWAVNDVSSGTDNGQMNDFEINNTETDSYDPNEVPVSDDSIETYESYVFDDYQYNTVDDVHASEIIDFSTISIDGHLISLPCDYITLKNEFSDLHTEMTTKYDPIISPVDETKEEYAIEVIATPTTGAGHIAFLFTPEDPTVPTTINNMKVTEVYLYGGNTKGEQLMTIGLPEGTKFGEDFSVIHDRYRDYVTNYHTSDDVRQWDMDVQLLEGVNMHMSGADGGLLDIRIIYTGEVRELDY